MKWIVKRNKNEVLCYDGQWHSASNVPSNTAPREYVFRSHAERAAFNVNGRVETVKLPKKSVRKQLRGGLR